MATTAVAPPEQITEREDLVIGYWQKKDETGKITKTPDVLTQEEADAVEKAKSEGKADKRGEFDGLSAVTVSTTYPKTFEALQALYQGATKEEGVNPFDELVANHNRGARTKVGNRSRAKLLATDDDGNLTYDGKEEVNGVLDLTGEITSGSKRKFLTEEEKVIRSIMAMPIPEAQKKQMLEVYQNSTKQ